MKKSLKIIIILLSIFIILFLRSQTVATDAAASERDKITEREKKKAIDYSTLQLNYNNSFYLGFFYAQDNFEIIKIDNSISIIGRNSTSTFINIDITFSIFDGFGNYQVESPNLVYERYWNYQETIDINIIDLDYIDIESYIFLDNGDNYDSMLVDSNSRLTYEIDLYSDDFGSTGKRFSFSYIPFGERGGYLNAAENYQYISVNEGVKNIINAVEVDAYTRGLNAAETFSFNFEWLSSIFDSLSNVLNIELFNGFRLWYLIGIPAFILLIYGVLKLFR